MHPVFLYDEFNDHDLGDGESPLRKKFNAIIEDLEENKSINQGSIKLISTKCKSCAVDEGGPLGTGLQEQVSNNHKLLW